MAKPNCLYLIFFLLSCSVYGQKYGYTHYDLKDGLAGSVVNCMVQDKEGFIWFGTETGLSRFDGTHFKTFTQQDGLPDDEIIRMYTDKKGRVWMSPYKKSICYYYKGKIYNPQNDSVLKKVEIQRLIFNFAEDSQGDILVQEHLCLHLIKTNGQVLTIDQVDGKPFTDLMTVSAAPDGGFWVIDKNRWYKYVNNRFVLLRVLPYYDQAFTCVQLSNNIYTWKKDFSTIEVTVGNPHTTFTFPTGQHLQYRIYDINHVAVCTVNGVYLYDVNRPDEAQFLLPNIAVNSVVEDLEGGLWFATQGKGVYRLNSLNIHNLPAAAMTKTGDFNQQVMALAKFDSSILVAADKDCIFRLSARTGEPHLKPLELKSFRWPVVKMCTMGNYILYASKLSVFKLTAPFNSKKRGPYIGFTYTKALFPYKNKLYIASNQAVLIADPVKMVVEDTLWRDRATSLFVDNDTVFFGTVSGLYRLNPDRSAAFLGDSFPVFKQRIYDIGKDSTGILWIATNGAGLVGFKNGHIVTQINQQHGMTSNTCRTLFIQKDAVWTGTDKGLNRIDLLNNNYTIRKYTTGDGLISDFINALYVEGSKVFVGTAEGVTFFDEQKVGRYSRCDLLFTDIKVSGQSEQWDSTEIQLPHEKNNIRFDYVGISYKSAGDIRYRYRLIGVDSNWNETRETFLSYPTLPSGDYELQIQAINKFDVYSKILSSRFTIKKLLWEKTWFLFLAGIVFLGITGLLVWFIALRIRNREREKTAITQRISDLEQLARKAQMNPHFIFNSLNSIQQYVMDADLTGANKFISGFSRLIRQTLDFSSRQEISLEEELDYLKNYLELEKDRLEDAFSWQVIVDENIIQSDYYLPPMILQPFVENSVRHGLRFRKDRNGKITIHIKKEQDFLVCIIEDNGIGRKAAQKLKSSAHIEYQSKGMSLTAERIAMLNKDHANKITMQIDDLENEQHQALGTRVMITFPVT